MELPASRSQLKTALSQLAAFARSKGFLQAPHLADHPTQPPRYSSTPIHQLSS